MPKGFSLIELLIVVAIIGILSVVLLPAITNGPAKARDATRIAAAKDALSSIELFALDDPNGAYPNRSANSYRGCLNIVAPDQYKKEPISAPSTYDALLSSYKCGSVAAGIHPMYIQLQSGYAVVVPVELKASANTVYKKAMTGSVTKSSYKTNVIDKSIDDIMLEAGMTLPYGYVILR